MNEERKDEIIRQYLLRAEVSIDAYQELELQELIFLIHMAKKFQSEGADEQGDFLEKIKAGLSEVHEKLKHADALYLAFDKITNCPYLDPEERIWLFSKEEYALLAQDYFLQRMIQLDMRKIGPAENMIAFAELHRLGIRKILIDNGQYHIEVERDAILPPPDWSGTPEINIPVTNPELQHAMIRFFQTMSSRSQYEGKQQHLYQLEGIMIEEILNGNYLIPMKVIEDEPSAPDEDGVKTLQQGATLQFACLDGQDQTTWLPVFTDWVEFEKAYDKTQWSGNVATYADMVALSERMDGAVINSRGISFQINANNKQRIEEFRRQQEAPRAASVQEHVVPQSTKIVLGEPAQVPAELIRDVTRYMKQQKRIKKAYLLQMSKDAETGYLIAVEAEGRPEELFNGIAETAEPHLQGVPLDLTGMTDWVLDAVKEIQPFYRKKLLGMF
ncbi:type III secretion system (T3SS) SseB-like protein [Tumebacillus sp. BK434]|uniref:enhanced serine sensitivity protein SseB C-terminal domain-containing protein n=1 Tax=Tumebacillus sp. BK434 TaxID=2512169 RepID=UPI0010DCC06E|nr:enhanced serine sensitivity protein SseB C-terminal domain-containing protein [Tumebacillus sp. BK434]TCP52599.1 type III secretion system (T3SS) SseB-like protein [Tumebacillus sp. BK434]